MIQALIATIVNLVSLMFAVSAGAFFEESKSKPEKRNRAGTCLVISVLLAACALGVAAR